MWGGGGGEGTKKEKEAGATFPRAKMSIRSTHIGRYARNVPRRTILRNQTSMARVVFQEK